MNSFNFTHKKFTSLSPTTQNKWIIKWLTELYQNLITNRISTSAIHEKLNIYNTILKWINQPCQSPSGEGKRALMEFISDSIHAHRIASGLNPKDHELLPTINLNDSYRDHGVVSPSFDTSFDTSFDLSSINTPKSKNIVKPDYHIALDGLRSLFNIGSIFRTCDAAGFQSIILGSASVKDHPTVKKTSMGASSWIPCTQTHDLAGTLMKIKEEEDYQIIGVETVEESKPYHLFEWPPKAVAVFGNEEYGISSHTLRICDRFVHIPMAGRKNSINVGCAAAVIAFHVSASLSLQP